MMSSFRLYYEENSGDIKAVTPTQLDEFDHYSSISIKEDKAAEFISGDLDTSEWCVVADPKGKAKLYLRGLDIQPIDSGALYNIPPFSTAESLPMAVMVSIYRGSKTFEVAIPQKFIGKRLQNIKAKELQFIITKKNDPTVKVAEITIEVAKLMKTGSIRCQFESKLNDFSVITPKVFREYRLLVSSVSWINANSIEGRFNKLVAFRNKKAYKGFSGVKAVHNINTNTIVLSVVGTDVSLNYPGDDLVTLFITKPLDPTILIDKITFSFEELSENHEVTIPLNSKAGKDFGIGGFPIADNLIFTRTAT